MVLLAAIATSTHWTLTRVVPIEWTIEHFEKPAEQKRCQRMGESSTSCSVRILGVTLRTFDQCGIYTIKVSHAEYVTRDEGNPTHKPPFRDLWSHMAPASAAHRSRGYGMKTDVDTETRKR